MVMLVCSKCDILYDDSETVAREERDFEVWCIACDDVQA